MASVETQTESDFESDTSEALAEYANDDKYRFAYDIVKAVVQWSKGITLSDSEVPTHENFLFTDVHSDDVLDFLQLNGKELKKLVAESAKETPTWNHDDDNYIHCKRKVLEDHKPPLYTEKEFVRLCAGIALVAVGNQNIEETPSAISASVQELKSWMNEVLSTGGTLQNSTWAED